MTRVAIIGGGIGGLTAASALLRAGAEVSVYEAAGELKEIGAGVALHANAMRVLRFIGVEDACGRSPGGPSTRSPGTGSAGGSSPRPAGRGPGGGAGHRARHGAPGRPARRACRGAAGRAGVARQALRRPRAPRETSAVARFADGSTAEADVIIGADGIHSAVRTSLFGPDAPRFTGKICYRSVIPTAAVRGGGHAGRTWRRTTGSGSGRTARSCSTRCAARS